MSIKEDRDEFNMAGLRGVIKKAMKEKPEAFVRELAGGWGGEVVPERPPSGSGPYVHYKVSNWCFYYPNAYPGDERVENYRLEL